MRLVAAAGALIGLGAFLAIFELLPAPPGLAAALQRLDMPPQHPPSAGRLLHRLARQLTAAAPWLPTPAADLELLGQDRDSWLASKIACGLLGLAAVPALAALLALAGDALPVTIPAAGSLVAAGVLFFLPDLVVRSKAREKRRDFRHAIASYLDLVALERGAGAAPTEALEAAAEIGGGWAFARLAAALAGARRAGRPPWDGLGELATRIGISELGDLADIAGVAGQEGARILDTLAARAESMRAEELASMRARAGAQGTTMALPITLIAVAFVVLLIFPVLYQVASSGP